jgi:hypothetical protein
MPPDKFVLVVDDVAVVRETVCAVVEQLGYSSITAAGGVEAKAGSWHAYYLAKPVDYAALRDTLKTFLR